MATKYLFINDSGNGQAIKAIREGFPKFYVEPPLAYKKKSSHNTVGIFFK